MAEPFLAQAHDDGEREDNTEKIMGFLNSQTGIDGGLL